MVHLALAAMHLCNTNYYVMQYELPTGNTSSGFSADCFDFPEKKTSLTGILRSICAGSGNSEIQVLPSPVLSPSLCPVVRYSMEFVVGRSVPSADKKNICIHFHSCVAAATFSGKLTVIQGNDNTEY